MRKLFTLSIAAFQLLNVAKAQTAVTDTVSLSPGYANHAWYKLSDGTTTTASKTAWDLAFDVSGYGTNIRINSITGTVLYNWPNGDADDWATTFDTAGLSTWTKRYNSDTSWALGAFSGYADPTNQFDVDWGIYNVNTHIVTGDSIYIIGLANGDYKKLFIEDLSSGAFNFKYADLDGSNEQIVAFTKADYTGKTFGYYSLQNNAAADLEPFSTDWDLEFTQYTAFLPGQGAYTVSGVLSGPGVTVAEVAGVGNVDTFSGYLSQTFTTKINEIGYDWKSFSGTAYTIADSLLYFVATADDAIYKVVMTGFGGGSTGNFIFTKELISATGIEANEATIGSLALYPNPANGNAVAVILNLKSNVGNGIISLTDLAGKVYSVETIHGTTGLHQIQLPTQGLSAGIYFVSVDLDGVSVREKLIVTN